MGVIIVAIFRLLYGLRQRVLNRRREGRQGYLANALLSGLLHGFFLSMLLLGIYAMWVGGLWPMAMVIAAVGLVFFSSPLLMRLIVVPLGASRAAHQFGRMSINAGADSDGLAVVYAAWAQLKRPSKAGQAFVTAKLAERIMVGDAEVVAHGLLAISNGDRSGGRTLLASIEKLSERHAEVRELAGEYLAAADAVDGNWQAILARAEASQAWPANAMTYFIEACAARIVDGARAPSRVALAARWLMAPAKFTTYSWLRKTMNVEPTSDVSSSSPVVKVVSDEPCIDGEQLAPSPLRVAAKAHLAAVLQNRLTAEQLADIGGVWDANLANPTLRSWFNSRALELGLEESALAAQWQQLENTVADDLAAMATASTIVAATGAGAGSQAASSSRNRLLSELEMELDAWSSRANSQLPLPAIDEWRAFVGLRAKYNAACVAGGTDLQQLLFVRLISAGSAVSVWLWNKRKEYVISEAITHMLLEQATAVGDVAAIETQSANAKIPYTKRSV